MPEGDLTIEEGELLALEEEYEELRLSQLGPSTQAEKQAFVSLRLEDVLVISTLAEGRLGPGMRLLLRPFFVFISKLFTLEHDGVLTRPGSDAWCV